MRGPLLSVICGVVCLLFCGGTNASVIDQKTIQDILREDSGIPGQTIEKLAFKDFDFEIGTSKSAKIITAVRSSRASINWSENGELFLLIKSFPQKRYDQYVDELDLPKDIIHGLPSRNSQAVLQDPALRKSWRVGETPGMGVYCVGTFQSGSGGGVVSTGYFFNDEYGVCLQISCPQASAIGLDGVERIGKELITRMVNETKAEGLVTNPLSQAGPFSPPGAKPRESKRTPPADRAILPAVEGKDTSNIQSPASAVTAPQERFLRIIVPLLALGTLIAIFLVWRKLRKQSS